MSLQERDKLFKFERDGWFNYQEVYDLAVEHCKTLDTQPVLVEIGLWKGMSFSYLVLKAKEQLGEDVKVYGVDTFRGDPNNPREQELIQKMELPLIQTFLSNMEKLNIRNGQDYYLLDMESVLASKYVQKADFVFVDGGHLKEQVLADIKAWLPRVKKGGILAGHDFDAPGVKEAVEKMFGDDYKVINTSWVYKNA